MVPRGWILDTVGVNLGLEQWTVEARMIEISDKAFGASIPIILAVIKFLYTLKRDVDAAHEAIRELRKK